MNEEAQYEIIVEKGNPDTPNLRIEADMEKGVKIIVNGHRLFNTFAHKDAILVGLNDKLTELLKRHIDSQAVKETDARNGR